MRRRLNQCPFGPAQFNDIDAAEVAYAKFIFLIRSKDVFWSCIERPVFSEMGDPLKLKQPGPHGIHSHRVFSDEKPFVFGDEPSVKVVGSPVVELGTD